MTERPETLEEAIDERDITLAFTPGQLILIVVGVYLLIRILRGLRG
ncbi:MAG: hypothetical protein ACRDGV_04885 [Candidatus Limnocylindria bacterium]